MGLNAPVPGLRPLYLNAKSPAKVALSVKPGEVLAVSDDVAAQLVAGDPHFVEYDEAGVAAVLAAVAPPEVEPDLEPEPESRPARKARSRKA